MTLLDNLLKLYQMSITVEFFKPNNVVERVRRDECERPGACEKKAMMVDFNGGLKEWLEGGSSSSEQYRKGWRL